MVIFFKRFSFLLVFAWLYIAINNINAQNINSRLNVNPSGDDGAVSGVEVNWQALQKLSPNTPTKIPLKNFEDFDVPSAISGLSSEYSRLLFPQSPTKTRLEKPASMRGTSPQQNADKTAQPLNQQQVRADTKRNITADNRIERLRPENERLNNIGAAALRAQISAPKQQNKKVKNNDDKITLTPLPILPNNKAIDYFAHQEIKPFTPSPPKAQESTKASDFKSANTQLAALPTRQNNIQNGDINIVVPKPITKVKPKLKITKAATPKPTPNKKLSDMRGKISNLLDKNITKKTSDNNSPPPAKPIIVNTVIAKQNQQQATQKSPAASSVSSSAASVAKTVIPVLKPLPKANQKTAPTANQKITPTQKPTPKSTLKTTDNTPKNTDSHLSINLNAGVAKLSDDSINSLKPIAQKILNNPNQYVVIRAYAGSDQSSLSAQKRLSLQRALNTRNALKSLGLKTNQVQVKPMGYVAQEANNDRVDIIVKSKS